MSISPASNNAIRTPGLRSVGQQFAQLPLSDLTASAASQPAARADLRRELLADEKSELRPEEKALSLAEALMAQDPGLILKALVAKDYPALLAKLSLIPDIIKILPPAQAAKLEQASELLRNLQHLSLRGSLLSNVPFDFDANPILKSDPALFKAARGFAIKLLVHGKKPVFIADQLNKLFTGTAKQQPGWLELINSVETPSALDEGQRKRFYLDHLLSTVSLSGSVWNADIANVIGPGGPPAVRNNTTDPRYDAFFGGREVMTRVLPFDYRQTPVYEKVTALLKKAGWEIVDWDKGKAKKTGTKNQTKPIVELIGADQKGFLKLFRERILSTDKMLITRDPTQIAKISYNRCWVNCLEAETGESRDKFSTELFSQKSMVAYLVRGYDLTAINPTGAALITQFNTYSPTGERLDQPALHVLPEKMGNVYPAIQGLIQDQIDTHFNQSIAAGYSTMLHDFPVWPFSENSSKDVGYGDHERTFHLMRNGQTVNLNELGNLDFSEWNFSGKEIVGTTLVGGDFSGADFSKTRIVNTHLVGGYYKDANFDGAVFLRKYEYENIGNEGYLGYPLIKSGFVHSNLNGASFVDADLNPMNFFSSQLRGVNFDGAKLSLVGFYNNDMRGAKLSWQNATVTLIANDLRNAEIGKLDPRFLPGIAKLLLTNRLEGATFDEAFKLEGPLSSKEALFFYARSPEKNTLADSFKKETIQLLNALSEISPDNLGNKYDLMELSMRALNFSDEFDEGEPERFIWFLMPQVYGNLLDNLKIDQFKILGDDPEIQQAIAEVKPQLDVLRQMADEADKADEANQASSPTVPDPYAPDEGTVYRPDPSSALDPRAEWPINNAQSRTVFDPNDSNNRAPVFSTMPGDYGVLPPQRPDQQDPTVNPNYPVTPEGKNDQERKEQREREDAKQGSLLRFPDYVPYAPGLFQVSEELSLAALVRSRPPAAANKTPADAEQALPAAQLSGSMLGQPPVSAVELANTENLNFQKQLEGLKAMLNRHVNDPVSVQEIQQQLTGVARSVQMQISALEQLDVQWSAGANQPLKAAVGTAITVLKNFEAWAKDPNTAQQLQKGAARLGAGVLTIVLTPLAVVAWLYGQLSGSNSTQGAF